MRKGVLALLWAVCIINGLLSTDAGECNRVTRAPLQHSTWCARAPHMFLLAAIILRHCSCTRCLHSRWLPGTNATLHSLCSLLACARTGPSCGLNAVRHRQDHQLRKLLGDSYRSGRRLQAVTSPQTRLQKLLASSQPATMRIHTEFQLQAGFLTAEQTKQLQKVFVPAAVKILQQYVKVRS